jgi:hypothetical protein
MTGADYVQVEEESHTVTNAVPNVFTTETAANVAFAAQAEDTQIDFWAQDYTVVSTSLSADTELVFTDTTVQLFERTTFQEEAGVTYYPLAVEETGNNSDPYRTMNVNTGYVISGTTNQHGDIRVSQYSTSDITNSYSATALSKSTISNNGHYMVLNSDGTIGNTDDLYSATVWTFTSSGNNTYYISAAGANNATYYLRTTGNNNLTTTTSTGNRTSWTFNNNRFSVRVGNTTVYIRYNNGSWTASNSTTNATISHAGSFTTVYTRDNTAGNNGIHEYTANSEVYQRASVQFLEVLRGTNNVYGLHFMNATIGTNNLVTAPKVKIVGKTYEDYEMPKDTIDFRLKDRGAITFFAGTYYNDNDSFFSLHKIERYVDTDAEVVAGTKKVNDIKSIREILEVYTNPDNPSDPYIYRLKQGNGSTLESWTYSSGGIFREHKVHDSLPSGYQLAFDTAWITDHSVNYQTQYTHDIFYFEIPADQGEYALGSVEGGRGAYLMYLDIGASGGALKAEGNALFKTVELEVPDTVRQDAGIISYEIPGLPTDVDVKSYPTYFPLTWEEDGNGDRTGNVSTENTGYVVSGANTNSSPPGDIRVSRYTKYAGGNWASIRNSLTSQNNAGTLNNNNVYTIVNGTQQSITQYGIGNQYTQKYRRVSAEMNNLLAGNQYVYALHFMQSAISTSNLVTVDKAVIHGTTYENYQMPQDAIDFNVFERGRITFFAGTYFSGSNGVQSFFSLHQIFRNNDGTIAVIRELSSIYGDGTSNSYIYEYTDGSYFTYDADNDTMTICAAPSGDYVKIYDLRAISDPNAVTGAASLTQNSAYYFEIPLDPGEYALGSSSSDGAYLMYLDIAANAHETMMTTITEVTEKNVRELDYPNGVAFVDAADSTAFDDENGKVDPEKSTFATISIGDSDGDTTFAISSGADLRVTNDSSDMQGWATPKSIAEDGSLTVNNGTPITLIGDTVVTETVTKIDVSPNGETVTTVTVTTKTTDGKTGAVTTTVEQTVTVELGGTSTTTTTTPVPAYDGHTLAPPKDYTQSAEGADASVILAFRLEGTGLSNDVSLVQNRNDVVTDPAVVVTVDTVDYTVYDVQETSAGAGDAGVYAITVTGPAGTYEDAIEVTTLNDDFTFNLNGTPLTGEPPFKQSITLQ